MTREEKTAAIEDLKEKFSSSSFFYLADSSAMTVAQVNVLRRKLHEQGMNMRVVKNTLARKAMEAAASDSTNFDGLYDSLTGPTAIIFTEVANSPAKIIKAFRKKSDVDRPQLKAAYIDSAIYIGDDQLDTLVNLKSKEDLLGELIGLLNSPMSSLLSQLGSGGQNVMGLLKAIETKG
ncbi:MAG: 50S ribosomal protein L10 [Saprospiraceae bacterium]|nr:50S ribosomal protein L10 [Saprospiraceae bacterium]MCF8251007.1 50S ribosomal protein L10 [Saprospiraceae bacterium]MCF8282810.1 50S ribosomal protein L10 [Bacteroidales bacterium]MCF8311604.1 50S ribosomal protein L10 [Saprospiraceae bacterium]MCF8440945.1 50S ribosomal protein L10 [Saprospiraceae bacterium]